MFFSTLHSALAGKYQNVTLSIQLGPDTMTIIVTPKVDEAVEKARAQLGAPFMVKGTPAELDAEFAKQFTGLAVEHQTIADQVARQIAAQKTAKSSSPTLKTSTKSNTKAALEEALSEGQNDDESDVSSNNSDTTNNKTEPQKAAQSAATVPMTADSLFD